MILVKPALPGVRKDPVSFSPSTVKWWMVRADEVDAAGSCCCLLAGWSSILRSLPVSRMCVYGWMYVCM